MNPDLQSLRAQKARLASRIGKVGYAALLIVSVAMFMISAFFAVSSHANFAYLALSPALLFGIIAVWYKQDLALLLPDGKDLTGRLSGDVLNRLNPSQPITPRNLWNALDKHWQTFFFLNHFLLPSSAIVNELGNTEAGMDVVWNEVIRLANATECQAIEPGHIIGALMITSPNVQNLFKHLKLSGSDIEAVTMWLGRILTELRREKPYFGGIGRDWANGFTPQLNAFGRNISLGIENSGGHYDWLSASPGVTALKNALGQNAGTIALVGPTGIGKTSHVYALAQNLLQEGKDQALAHKQVIELNSSLIISSAQHPGELEHIVMNLLNETVHAGHIILFLDDAQLFFKSGPGSFDVTQILLPVAQSKVLQIVLAMTPNDYQSLRSNNPAFASLITPVVLTEPDELSIMRILEDNAVGLEHKGKVLIAYEALREAYRLSGRYEQDTAFPGKAIQLLQQSLTHANNKIVTALSVQQAIEQTRGVKVGTAAPVEADALLHLEDDIHKRMINQVHAVKVVASALRRARAGVSNPRRPIGSFLFLGPTGVGKTELAKAVAMTYFGAESNMVRLDMSEYQQPQDVSRLLSDGQSESRSLIMAVRQQPFSVILLDEIEKAHANILNLLLQLLDEGQLTDTSGRAASFKDCIIIATSNAGAQTIRERIGRGETLESFESAFTDELINSGQFKPELLNRFDEIVLFRPLNEGELAQVVGLMMKGINQTLSVQNISVELTDAAIKTIVEKGNDARLGARPMRRMLQKAVEDGIAGRILRGETRPGDHVALDVKDLSI